VLGKVKVEVRLILGLAISPPHYLHDPRPTLVIVPDDVNGVDIPYLGGHTIVGGHDFGEITVIDDTPFGECGSLCSGCLGYYQLSAPPDSILKLLKVGKLG
jgi:hypothetical protein